MFKVLSRRRVINNSLDYVDGTLEKDDHIIEQLRSQIKAMAIASSDIEKENMNILSSIERENSQASVLLKARLQTTVLLNSSLKVSEESLTKKVADLEREAIKALVTINEEKIRSQVIGDLNSSLQVANDSLREKITGLEIKVEAAKKSSDEERTSSTNKIGELDLQEGGTKRLLRDLITDTEKLKWKVTSNDADSKATKMNIQKLQGKRAQIKVKFGHSRVIERQKLVEHHTPAIDATIAPCTELNDLNQKYNEEVKRNNLLEEQIQVIVTREETATKCLAQTKRDAEDSILQRNKIIDTLREELNASKMNIIRLEDKIQSIEERDSHEGTARLTKHQLEDEQRYAPVDLCKKLEVKEEEEKGFIADDTNSGTLIFEEKRSVTANLQVQVQKKDIISQMNQISCKKNGTEQTYNDEQIEDFKIELQQKNTKIECISKENEKNLIGLKQREADFHLVIQKHQVKLVELDEMREKYEIELERNNILKQQAKGGDALKHEKRLQIQDSEINLLKDKLTRANADEQEHLRENTDLQKSTFEHDERLRNQRLEIDELKKKLTNANVAKSEIEITLKESTKRLSRSIEEKEDNNDEKKEKLEGLLEDVEKKCTDLERQLKEKQAEAKRMQDEIDQIYKNFRDQTAAKKNEISELHEELLEKTNLLTVRERDLGNLKYEVDAKKLRYETNIKTLRAEIMSTGGESQNEVERLSARNLELEYDIVESKQEIKQIRGRFASMVKRDESNGVVRILRNRNECLKNEVEKLTNRMKYTKEQGPSEM